MTTNNSALSHQRHLTIFFFYHWCIYWFISCFFLEEFGSWSADVCTKYLIHAVQKVQAWHHQWRNVLITSQYQTRNPLWRRLLSHSEEAVGSNETLRGVSMFSRFIPHSDQGCSDKSGSKTVGLVTKQERPDRGSENTSKDCGMSTPRCGRDELWLSAEEAAPPLISQGVCLSGLKNIHGATKDWTNR